MRNMFCGSSAVLVADLPFVALFLLLIFVIAEPIAWVIVSAIPFFLLLAWWSGRALEKKTRDERHAGLDRDALIAEMLAGRATVKALALGESYRSRWEERHIAAITRSFSRGSTGDSFTNTGLVVAALTTVAVTGFGAVAIIDQQLTIGALIATNMLGNRIISQFNQLVGVWRNHAQFKQARERLGDVFAQPGERLVSEISLARPKGEILLDDVSFTYDESRPPAIEGLKLHIKPGGIIGIVGNNGCGKTTLLKLAQGLYPPDHGRITLDGANIDQFTRRELAGWIGYVPQEATLFAGSIRENIAIANPEASDDEVVAAARLAGAHDEIVDLPNGYATDVGEAGAEDADEADHLPVRHPRRCDVDEGERPREDEDGLHGNDDEHDREEVETHPHVGGGAADRQHPTLVRRALLALLREGCEQTRTKHSGDHHDESHDAGDHDREVVAEQCVQVRRPPAKNPGRRRALRT